MIRIRSVKTKAYVKPISAELAALIQKAMEETETRYGTTKYFRRCRRSGKAHAIYNRKT